MNISAYKLHGEIGGKKLLFILAAILSSLALITLLVHTYHNDAHALLIFIAFILVSVLFEHFYGKWMHRQC